MNIKILLVFLLLFILLKNLENYDNNFLNNVVVKIFSQNIEFDWLEPYKNKKSYESIGTGFFITKDILLTAGHVIQNSIRVDITIPSIGKKKFKASVVCINPYYDFALLKMDSYKSHHFLKFGDSNKIKSGDKVLAVGYPLAQDKLKLTSGIISGIHNGKIQTDAPINKGNSGSPLLNKNEEVIGINISKYKSADNIGYAVPINRYKIYEKDMLNPENKIVYKPILGLTYHNTNDELLNYYNILEEGLMAAHVLKDGPIDRAGIQDGDIITKFDKYQLDKYGEISVDWYGEKLSFTELFNNYKIGDEIDITYYRKSKKKLLK